MYRAKRVDLFIYTFREVESMMRRGNPLILSALVEGTPIKVSSRVENLMIEARKRFRREGRMWIEVA